MISTRYTFQAFLALTLLVTIPACSDDRPRSASMSTSTNGGSGGSGGDSSGSTGGFGGSGMGGSGGSIPGSKYCAPDTVMTTPNGGNAFDVKTEHYDLYAEGSKEDAEEMAQLLEAAYPALQDYFEATPPLAAGQRLVVRFFADYSNWAAALTADGIMVPNEAAGYYSPTNSVAYLYKQGNPYYTHVLLLHEAVHQFHFLSRLKNPNLPFWLVEGVAEHLGRHDWDKKCVNLGVVPLLSWEDLPDDALSSSIDFSGIVNGNVNPTRAASWAIYRFLDHGDNGAHRAAFKSYRDAMDANEPNPSFLTLVGDPGALSPALSAYLPMAQEPMMPIYIEWQHVGQRAVFADSGPYFSLAVTKADVKHFETQYDVPSGGSWTLGVVLGYDDDQNYLSLVVDNTGQLRTFKAGGGNLIYNNAGTAPASMGNGTGFISVDYPTANEAKVTVNGMTSTYAITWAPQSGLALNNSAALFHDIDWN